MACNQIYDPVGSQIVSTMLAGLPIVVLLGGLALVRIEAHRAALVGLIVALAVAVFVVYGLPVPMAGQPALYEALFGLLPIGWIVFKVLRLRPTSKAF